jgi:hypothetical protein
MPAAPTGSESGGLRARTAAVAIVVLVVVACGSDRRLAERPRTAPQPVPPGVTLAVSGAVEGALAPTGVPTCTTTTATIYGEIGGEKYSLTVFAPFASLPGGGTVDLPPPAQLDAGIVLTGVRTGSWAAARSRGSGRITVGPNPRSGSFDALLVGEDESQVTAVGSWECAP